MSCINRTRGGLTLVEVMIVIMIAAIFLSAVNYFLRSISEWKLLAATQDAMSEDIAAVWSTLNEDFNKSTWYYNNTPPAAASYLVDRGQFYVPYVVQPGPGAANAMATDPNLTIFNRVNADGAGPYRLDVATWGFSGLAKATDIDAVIPGDRSDASKTPSGTFSQGTTYRSNYFAPSQELVFVRCFLAGWNRQANAPKYGTSPLLPAPSLCESPSELFRAPTDAQRAALNVNIVSWWTRPNNQANLGVLSPSPFVKNPLGGWMLRVDPATSSPVVLPYGEVMDGTYLDTSTGAIALRPLLEQQVNPDRTSQPVGNVRLMGYQVVRSPLGFGRLVRTYVKTITAGALPLPGVEPGQYIAAQPAVGRYLMVDKVVSDSVVRVLFETARHDADLGINNIRATIFLAKLAERPGAGNTLIIRRMVTMVFTMRGANTAPDQAQFFTDIGSATPIPFTYN